MSRPHLLPTADHPITITPTQGTVTVRVGDREVARTDAALTLQESTYPAVQYIPLSDVDSAVLVDSATTTYCPYKGEANYYSVKTGEDVLDDLIWTYRNPYPAVDEIEDHVAFYPDRASIAIES